MEVERILRYLIKHVCAGHMLKLTNDNFIMLKLNGLTGNCDLCLWDVLGA